MQAAVLERRPLYGIGTVARLTGLKPDTLRVWERRYGLGASHKSATGRRQYTQGDLEHLQLIAALVKNGSRIGEIARSERKTLETLLRGVGVPGNDLPVPKPRIGFIGAPLCDWLSQHQGCLAGVDALLVRARSDALPAETREALTGVDALVVFSPGLTGSSGADALALGEALGARRVLLTHEFGSERSRDQLQDQGLVCVEFPPDPARLAFELSRCAAEKITAGGQSSLADLIQPRPREFTSGELQAAAALQGALVCECPRHIALMVESLANFERYSSECSAENWEDAAAHARIYAFTAQARWLMERALHAALEGHEDSFSEQLAGQGAPVEA